MTGTRNRLYERVATALASQIVSGQYAVGDRLPAERDLALTFDVSRPTVREAIIALELDGFVQVRKGSGVYIISLRPSNGERVLTDVGPFELLDARRAIEGEVTALAAARISDDQLRTLSMLVDEMERATSYASAERADRQFHVQIAEASGNSVLVESVSGLWQARERSPQYQLLARKAHEAGIGPVINEHRRILEALTRRKPGEARMAMQDHVSRVLETLLQVTEVHEIEQARARLKQERQRFYMAG